MGKIKFSTPRIRRVLVPLDFSGKSRQALHYAVPVARKFGAKIILVHVASSKGPLGGERQGSVTAASGPSSAARKRLEATAAQLIPRGQYAGSEVLVGNPGREILDVAKRHEVDLIVLSTTGKSGLQRMLLGSTAEFVVRHTTCPVVCVPRR